MFSYLLESNNILVKRQRASGAYLSSSVPRACVQRQDTVDRNNTCREIGPETLTLSSGSLLSGRVWILRPQHREHEYSDSKEFGKTGSNWFFVTQPAKKVYFRAPNSGSTNPIFSSKPYLKILVL